MGTSIIPFLMFTGRAEEAMNFYVSLLPEGRIVEVVKYGAGQPGPEGSVKRAVFTVAGQQVMCTDSFIEHAFNFTPSFSFFVGCESEEQLLRLYTALADSGAVLMPLENYGFSKKFAWVNDRFGVSWQLNLA